MLTYNELSNHKSISAKLVTLSWESSEWFDVLQAISKDVATLETSRDEWRRKYEALDAQQTAIMPRKVGTLIGYTAVLESMLVQKGATLPRRPSIMVAVVPRGDDEESNNA